MTDNNYFDPDPNRQVCGFRVRIMSTESVGARVGRMQDSDYYSGLALVEMPMAVIRCPRYAHLPIRTTEYGRGMHQLLVDLEWVRVCLLRLIWIPHQCWGPYRIGLLLGFLSALELSEVLVYN